MTYMPSSAVVSCARGNNEPNLLCCKECRADRTYSGGAPQAKSAVCSNACATRIMSASPNTRPMICSPTGSRPPPLSRGSSKPQGTVMAGNPARPVLRELRFYERYYASSCYD